MRKIWLLIKAIIYRIHLTAIRCHNRCVKKDKKSIFFYPHANCKYDGYDILNGDSSNVLCLVNDILKDSKFNDYQLYILYYHKERLKSYQEYCSQFGLERIHFVFFEDYKAIREAIFKCYTIFIDADYTRINYRVSNQRVVLLNYFGGLIKGEFFRWENHGGFKRMIKEQFEMKRMFDYHLSISDICSKFIALDNCHYYPHFISLGFPRNDIFFWDNSQLRKQVEELVNFQVKKIITYSPTHRDYENPNREFFDSKKITCRSIFGDVTEQELEDFENILSETGTLIIAKVHPIQQAQTTVISSKASKHILFYSELAKHIKTSLNPLLAISDSIITDYTTTVYDFLYTNRPIIYYFYDIERYRETRGFFIEPIESICAGHLTYNLSELGNALKDIVMGNDPFRTKRQFLQELFIKYLDGKSSERIKEYFFEKQK